MKNLATLLLMVVVFGLLAAGCPPAREEVVVPTEAAPAPGALQIRVG